MKIMITGIGGSAGSYLVDHIIENHPNVEIQGMTRWHTNETNLRNIEKHLDKIKLFECDLTDFSSLIRTLQTAKPDVIFHLASYANVRTAFQTPLAVINNNVTLTANLFEAVHLLEINPRILMCSTSEVYGNIRPEDVPITENCSTKPVSPYAVSKLTQDALAYSYYKAYNMDIVITRMFTYTNPRRRDLFSSAFTYQIIKVENEEQKELLHGNLESVRCMIDVRDAMEAYWIAMEKCKAGEVYNIGGQIIVKVSDFLEMLKNKAYREIPCRLDPTLLRPIDVTLQIPNTEKFEKQTGWKARYSLEEMIDFLLRECRKMYKNRKAI